MPPGATEAYHELLTGELAADSQAHLDAQLRRRGLYFGGRALCTVLRPRFLDPRQYRFLQRTAALILRAFRAAHAAALADEAILDRFGLTGWEREIVRIDAGFRDSSPVSRLDAFFTGDGEGLRFTEYNAETPAGGAYNDALTEVFLGMPAMREFAKGWDLRPLPARHNVLHALLDAWRQWAAARGADPRRPPAMAIVDWRDVATWSEFVLFQQYFERQGLACELADPRELTFAAGRLTAAGGRPIDLVYKRVLLSELVERQGIEAPLLAAVRAGAVCMVNPPACKILHKKASLAVLSDERHARLFDPDLRAAIAAHIPWTRLVEERRTEFEGRAVDLLPFLAEHREQLVLKPNDEYGGKGIVLGWEVDQTAWERAVRGAVAEPFIAQWRIPLPAEPYPSLAGGRLEIADRLVDTAPYVAYGGYVDGVLSRLSTAALLNVTHGGGSQTPTFVVERR